MNLMFKFLKAFSVQRVENDKVSFFLNCHSKINRVMKIAQNNEVAIPIIKVVAKPLIGPVPNTKRINPVKPVVIFASIIDGIAPRILNASLMASFNPFPDRNSSRILS